MLVLSEKDLSDIYDEFMALPVVAALISFCDDAPDEIFPYKKDLVITSSSSLLGFCQEVLEWACVHDIAANMLRLRHLSQGRAALMPHMSG